MFSHPARHDLVTRPFVLSCHPDLRLFRAWTKQGDLVNRQRRCRRFSIRALRMQQCQGAVIVFHVTERTATFYSRQGTQGCSVTDDTQPRNDLVVHPPRVPYVSVLPA